jgi:hypothetical protein
MMGILTGADRRFRRRLLHTLDASFCIGRQHGMPVEVSLSHVLREMPCFLLIAAIFTAVIFL